MNSKNTFLFSLLLFSSFYSLNSMSRYQLKVVDAYKIACDGDIHRAIHILRETAKEDWETARVLEECYKDQNSITGYNIQESDTFNKLANELKEKSYCCHEFFVEEKLNKLKTIRFAQENPWYKEILNILNSNSNVLVHCYLPLDGLRQLAFRIYNDKESKTGHLVAVLVNGVKELNSEDAYIEVCKVFTKDSYSNCSRDKLESLINEFLPIVENNDWDKKPLEDLVNNYFDKLHEYLLFGEHEDKKHVVNKLVKFYPIFYNLNSERAKHSITDFIENYFKHYQIKNLFLLFSVLDNETLQEHSSKFFDDRNIEKTIETVLKSPSIITSFQETSPLNFDNIIKRIFETNNLKAISTFLNHAHNDVYNHYEDQIIQSLPVLLNKSLYEYHSILQLIKKTTNQRLKNNTLTILVEAVSSKKENFWTNSILKDLFKLDCIEKGFLYDEINKMFHQQRYTFGLQLLWLNLADEQTCKQILYRSISDFYHVTEIVDPNPVKYHDFKHFFNHVLRVCIDNKTLDSDEINQIVSIAHETGFEKFFDNIIDIVRDNEIFNERSDIKRRMIFLDERLFGLLSNKNTESINDFVTRLNSLSDTEFKKYVADVFTTLNTTVSSFVQFKAIREIQELHEKFGLKNSIPEVVRRTSGDLPNFSAHRWSFEKPTTHLSIDSELKDVQFDENLIFGVVSEYDPEAKEYSYELYACDNKDIKAVWRVGLYKGKNKPLFAIANDFVFVSNNNTVSIFNKNNGDKVGNIALQNNLPIFDLHFSNNKLYVIQCEELHPHCTDCSEDSIITEIDLISNKYTGYAIPENLRQGGKHYFIVGNKLARFYIPHDTITLFTNAEDSNQDGSLNTDKETFVIETNIAQKLTGKWHTHSSSIETKKNLMCFIRLLEDKSYQLVCFDTDTNSELWNYPVDRDIKNCISDDLRYTFTIQKGKVTKFDNNPQVTERKIWEIKLEGNFHYGNQIKVAPNNQDLYVFEKNYSQGSHLYKINIETGKSNLVAIIKEDVNNLNISKDNNIYLY